MTMKNDELIAEIKRWLPRLEESWDYQISEVIRAIPINVTDHQRDNLIPLLDLTQQDVLDIEGLTTVSHPDLGLSFDDDGTPSCFDGDLCDHDCTGEYCNVLMDARIKNPNDPIVLSAEEVASWS
jgi:hypothetical protein